LSRPNSGGATLEGAEAEVAVGDERAHAARLGERQRLAVVGLGVMGVASTRIVV